MFSFSSFATLQISTKILSDILVPIFFFFRVIQLSFQENTDSKEINALFIWSQFYLFSYITFKSTYFIVDASLL